MATLLLSVDGTEWPLSLDKIKLSEAEECEKRTGWTVSEWIDALVDTRARAIKFALYLAMTRSGDGAVDWDTLDMDLSDVKWDDGGDDTADTPSQLGVPEGEGPTGPEAASTLPLDAPA